MNRRDFIRIAAVGSVGLALPNTLHHIFSPADAAGDTELVVARGALPAAITRAAIDALGGMKRFISRGDIVVVKPNMAWDRTPEQAANTNPEVVATVVLMCYEAGAKKVKIFDRPVNDPRRAYLQSGIVDAVKPLGAEIDYMDDRKFREMKINGEALKTWPLYADIFEADKVINLPIAKHHSLAGLTMSMKNWMGVMGGLRRSIHQKLDISLADLSLVIRPTLTVLDAVRILTGNGPQGGDLKDVRKIDTVVAGTDQVAIDSFGATLFGMKGSDLGFVKEGARRGIGVMDLSKVKIKRVTV